MERLNKYWKISWWKIFDALDRKAHEIAIDKIWECVTANASINFFKSLDDKQDFIFDSNVSKISDKKCEVYIWILENFRGWSVIATAVFLFISK